MRRRNLELFKEKLKIDLKLLAIIFLMSIFFILITITYISLNLKYKILWISFSCIYGVYTVHIFLKPGLDYQIRTKMANLTLKKKLINSFYFVRKRNRDLILYAALTAILMTSWGYYNIKVKYLPFQYFATIFLAGSLFGASVYGLYIIRKIRGKHDEVQ